jgi:hypothetical protein
MPVEGKCHFTDPSQCPSNCHARCFEPLGHEMTYFGSEGVKARTATIDSQVVVNFATPSRPATPPEDEILHPDTTSPTLYDNILTKNNFPILPKRGIKRSSRPSYNSGWSTPATTKAGCGSIVDATTNHRSRHN